ncbi:MAG: hypothetical protein IJ123_07955 [Blautia sp.]|nr:hypothetical protein [Blautia sp.]
MIRNIRRHFNEKSIICYFQRSIPVSVYYEIPPLNYFLILLYILSCLWILCSKEDLVNISIVSKAFPLILVIEFFGFMNYYFDGVLPWFFTNCVPSGVSVPTSSITVAISGLFLCIVGFPFCCFILCKAYPAVAVIFRIFKKRKREFTILVCIHFAAIAPIIRANVNYIDDSMRVLRGSQIAGDYSRYLSNLLATVIHGNSCLTDASPLPQTGAAIILSFTGIIVLELITGNRKAGFLQIAALIPLGCICQVKNQSKRHRNFSHVLLYKALS